MADGKEVAAVETSVANPKQAVNVMENLDKVSSYNTPTYTLQNNPAQFKQEQNTSFFNSEAWKDYQSDMYRAFKKKYPAFSNIEHVSRNDLWRSSIDANGEFVVKRAQAIHSTYNKANNWFSRVREGYNFQRYGLRISAARKDLSDAIREGDELKIAEAKIKYQNELKNAEERGTQFKEYGDTLMSIAASGARNPETLVVTGIGAIAAVPTGGTSVAAATAINAGIVGADTYRLETGSALQQLDTEAPELSEEEKFRNARIAGITNAAVEAGLFAVGGNIASRGVNTIGGALGKRAIIKSAEKAAGGEVNKEAAKALFKTEFIKALQNPAQEKTLKDIVKKFGKDTVLGGAGEGGQEVFQDSVTNAMLRSVRNGTGISEELLDDWADFITDPFGSQHAEKWETFVNVMLASPIFSAGFNVVGSAVEYKKVRDNHTGLGNAADKFSGAKNNSLGLSRLFALQGEANAKQGTPVSNAVLQDQIKTGEVSGKLYTTAEQVKKMQEDPEIAEALEAMGVAKGLEEASENGGAVELDFAAYDKIVNEKQNETLFQKMRQYLSFSETTMSIEEYNQFVKDSGKKIGRSLSDKIRKDEKSIFNKAKNMFLQAGAEEGEAEGNAAIIHVFLTNAQGLTKDKQNDILDRVRVAIESKTGGELVTKFNNAIAESTVGEDGSRIVNIGDNKETAISFNKIAKGKNKGKYTVGIKDNTGLSSVMKDTGGWSTAEEKAKPALFDSEDLAHQAVLDMYAKPDGDGIDLNVGAAMDAIFSNTVEEYKDDTIVVDGKERPVYNHDGQKIANTKEALTNFWHWFGDSKVVDEQGRPLVVYHGSDVSGIEVFDNQVNQTKQRQIGAEKGYFFTDSKKVAERFRTTEQRKAESKYYAENTIIEPVTEEKYDSQGRYLGSVHYTKTTLPESKNFGLYPVYLKAESVNEYSGEDIGVGEERATALESAKQSGKDGVIIYKADTGAGIANEYIVFEPNQIKSVDNVGTFSSETGNIYHMFVGTKESDLSAMPQVLMDRIQEAKDMSANGESAEDIFKKTHIHIAPDGKLRIQISDKEAKLTDNDIMYWDNSGNLHGRSCRLGDIFEHELLFALYPALKDMPVTFGGRKTYMSSFGRMNIGYNQSKGRIRQSILHEVQHRIQQYEDFATGGQYSNYRGSNKDYWTREKLLDKVTPKIIDNKVITYWTASTGAEKNYSIEPDEMRALIDSPAIKEIAEKDKEFAEDIEEIRKLNKKLEGLDSRISEIQYMRLFGEAESRLTERLSYMSQEELDKLDPYEYFDVTQFIVKDRNTGYKFTVEAPKNKQKTGEFNVVFDAETGKSITDGSVIEAGRTTAVNGKYEIRLTPNANATTFAHEVFHMFSLELQRVYNSGNITDYWKKQAEKMFKLAGVPDIVDGYVKLTEAQEEKLANMFTTYIMKGKIENYEVRGMLSKLIEMFNTVYRQSETRDLTEKALDSKAYSFFNAVMSSQDAIEEVQRNAGLLEIAAPEGADRELYDYYIANIAISKVEASNDLRKKLFAIDTFKRSAEYDKLLQKFKDEAREELAKTPRYRIIAQSSLFSEENKVQQTTLWAQNEFPESNLTEGDVADILNNTKPLEQAVTEEANEEMNVYISQQYHISNEELGFKEERNRAKVRALLAESVMRRGGTLKDMELEIKKAEEASDKHLAKISVYEIMKTDKWKDREAAAVERYTWAKAQDRDDLMSAERFNQAVVNLIMIKANGYKSEYQKLTALFEKLQDRQRKYRRRDETGRQYGPEEHRYQAEDWELLRTISENFGNVIRDRRRSTKTLREQMQDWIKTQVENRFTTVADLEQFIPFIEKGYEGSIGSMSGRNFKKLWAVVGTINGIAMREQMLFLDGQYADMTEMVNQTIDFFRTMGIDTEGKTIIGTDGKFLGRYGTWSNPEPIAKAVFPEEVFRKIFLPMFQGATLSESVSKEWIDKWNKAKKKIDVSTKEFVLDDGTRITYGVDNKKVMTYADVANLLLAMGSEHSYQNYMLKFGIDEEQATKIASQAIKRNKNYVEFMNTTWEVYGEATEKLNKSFQERNNELFVKKEHRAFEIDGIKFEGGYVPEDKHYTALVRELGTWNQGTELSTKRQHKNEKLMTMAADGNILSIIDITETKLSQSAKWIYAAMPYNNIKKFLEDKRVNDLIGDKIFNFFKDWLQNWDTPHFDESGMWRPLSRFTTLSALGMRASTALLQVSGIVQAVARIGGVYVGRGMLQFVREGGFYKPFKIQEGKSMYMRQRVENPFANKLGMDIQGATFNEMFDKYNAKHALSKTGAALLTAYQRIGMSMIQLVDGWVATITWNAAYLKAKDKGLSDADARLEADSEVRITQSDAQQISRSAAMQEPWARAVTAFGTWTMGMRSQTEALTTSKKYRKELVLWTASWVVLASMIEAYLKDLTEPADKGDEDKEMLERVMHSWYNKMVEAVGTQFLPFAGLGSTGFKTLAKAAFDSSDDDEQIFKVFAGGNVSALQYAYRMVEAGAKLIDYVQTGEEEQRNKFFISASGLISNNIKKHIKKTLEDD